MHPGNMLWILAIAAALAGCASLTNNTPSLPTPSAGPTPGASFELKPEPCTYTDHRPEGGPFTFALIDASGLVVDCRVASTRTIGVDSHIEVTNTAPDVIDLVWLEGACSDQARVEVTGETNALNILIRLDTLPFECPAIGLPYKLTLTLSEPVASENVSANRLQMH
jgi:hypothetical protein